MTKRFFSEILLDLGDLEGDYRAFYLKNDIGQTILSLSIAVISVLAMLRVDIILFKDRPGLLMWLLAYRAGFVLLTLIAMFAIRKTTKVRAYDRLTLAWIVLMILFFILSSFTRPSNNLTTAFEIII